MSAPDSLPCATVKRWEEAGASLVAAFKDYMDLCLNLGTESLLEGTTPKDLVSRIDSTLVAVHTVISHHLNESSSALARTRNKLASPLFRFPEEVLSEIFMNVVYGRSNAGTFKLLMMEQEIWLIYRRLYGLLGVCSTWRDIVMTRGAFWSVIPIFSGHGTWRPSSLSLQRAGRSPLHLAVAASSPTSSDELATVLAECGPRFRTINIRMADLAGIMAGISGLLQHNTPGSLSELSIQCTVAHGEIRLPDDSDYIVPRDSTHRASFANLLAALTAFRISGVQLHWDTLTFSTQLVELRIEQVLLGYDYATFALVQALSSASGLRDLKIISVSTFRQLGAARHPAVSTPIRFPNLQSLFIRGLYLNTLEHLLPMIAPGSYHLTLCLSHISLKMNILENEYASDETEGGDVTEFDGLCRILEHTSVDVLTINGRLESEWWPVSRLAKLLKTMPTLKTLKMHNGSFPGDLCEALTRINDAQPPSEDHPLPELQTLHLSAARVLNKSSFHHMLASHPLREVVLGGNYQARQGQTVGWVPLREQSSVIKSLRNNMPNTHIRLVSAEYHPPELRQDEWKLWWLT